MAKKTIKKTLTFLLILCMAVSMLSVSAFAADANVAKIGEVEYATLAEAITAANADTTSDEVVIELIADTTVGAKMTISRNIKIVGAHTITRDDAYTKNLFTVNAGAKLVLDGVVIDGGNKWAFDEERFKQDAINGKSVDPKSTNYHTLEAGAPVATEALAVVNGSVVMNNGATIRNNAGASVFSVNNGGYLETNNAVITHNYKGGINTVAYVAAGGKWVINKDTVVSENYSCGGNGGLCRTEGTVIINGGLFTRNAGIGNGSIFMNYKAQSYLELNDGLFTGNYCLNNGNDNWNGVIHCHYDGVTTFVMNGGTITGNYTSSCGGISASCNNFKTPASITVNGGTVTGNIATMVGTDVSLGQNITIGGNATFEEMKAYKDVTVADGKTLTILDTLYFNGWKGAKVYTGAGAVDGNVYLYNNADVTMNSGSWLNGVVTVNAKGNTSTLIVKPGATIDGIQVRVLDSVASGNSENGDEATAAQAASYVEEDGANVKSPVLFYHRLTSAQMGNIVVTYDYNGGLDAQGWSGIQRTTSEESFTTTPLPAPTREGYELAGWKYAVNNDPECLTMEGADWYEDEAITQSLRLIAQWTSSTEDIPDDDPPLTDLPDDLPPKSDVPKTGDVSLLWLGLSVLSGCGVALIGKKRED